MILGAVQAYWRMRLEKIRLMRATLIMAPDDPSISIDSPFDIYHDPDFWEMLDAVEAFYEDAVDEYNRITPFLPYIYSDPMTDHAQAREAAIAYAESSCNGTALNVFKATQRHFNTMEFWVAPRASGLPPVPPQVSLELVHRTSAQWR